MYCGKCGAENPESNNFCSRCGTDLRATVVSPPVAPPAAPPVVDASVVAPTTKDRKEPSLGSESAWQRMPPSAGTGAADKQDLYRLIIGEKNQERYLRKFEQFDQQGRTSIGWHWPAFFVTFYWALYRKMWLVAVLYLLLPFGVAFVAAFVIGLVSPSDSWIGALIYYPVVILVPPMLADGLYYKLCQKRIRETLALAGPSVETQRVLLAAKGGTSNIVLVIVLLLGVVCGIGILAAVALPAYQDYTVRARTSEAFTYGKAAGDAVGRYYDQTQKIPATIAETGLGLAQPASVGDVSIDQQNGTLSLRFSAGSSLLAGHALTLTPQDTSKGVIWHCSADVADKYLPAECRK